MTDLSRNLAMTDSLSAAPPPAALQRITVPQATAAPESAPLKLVARGLDFHYDRFDALKGIDLDITDERVTALIGPYGCGKATLLRVFNRIYALYPKLEARGEVLLDGENILSPKYPMHRLRSRVGMVFQKLVPFPL